MKIFLIGFVGLFAVLNFFPYLVLGGLGVICWWVCIYLISYLGIPFTLSLTVVAALLALPSIRAWFGADNV